MESTQEQWCPNCVMDSSFYEDSGNFFCSSCYSQLHGVIDTAPDDEAFMEGTAPRGPILTRKQYPNASSAPNPADHLGPTEPADFGHTPHNVLFDELSYCDSLRQRYVLGVQFMIQKQCEFLVQEFKVTPLICGFASSVWLRFVASTRVFHKKWAKGAVLDYQNTNTEGKKRKVGKTHHLRYEPRDDWYNERFVRIWIKRLKDTIPLSCSLAVSYLACHIAREPVLPTDIFKWSVEGKLPYFDAYRKIAESIIQIERDYECPSKICPVKASAMFRPIYAFPPQKIESLAGSIAKSIGLDLPPINFYGLASRYLKQLSLPVGKIMPYACRIQEWSMPPDLWLSTNELRPTRVCVLSILIVSIRILYNINGFGKWETTLSDPPESSSMNVLAANSDESEVDAEEACTSTTHDGDPEDSLSSVHKYESECAEFLQKLEKRYYDLDDGYEYSKDLPTYLQYCKDKVFSGLEPSYKDPELIKELWEFYQKNREDMESTEEPESNLKHKSSKDNNNIFSAAKENNKHKDDEATSSQSTDSQDYMFEDGNRDCSPGGENTQRSQDISHSDYNSSGNNTPQRSQENSYSDYNQSGNSTPLRSQEKSHSDYTLNGNNTPGLQERKAERTTDGGESSQVPIETAIRHMKIDMEENRFYYLPPRQHVRRRDYVHYRRKGGTGGHTYVAHADYYILLRACAKVAQVDARVMHASVFRLEKRLAWLEKMIDYCLENKCRKKPGNANTSKPDS